ncbi:MAG TPA: protease pro-enzyme activation domain-containing protein [Bryobacteraceae bacterium]
MALLAAAGTILSGQIVHPLAQPRYDQGPVEGSLHLGYIQMMFQQTPAQQAGLDRLLASQRDPSSPDYHKWLTPEQYADRFGLSTDDLARVTAWLKSAGFTIESTARGRDWVVFSGTAAQVESALHTSVHRYAIGAETHVAIATEPVLPAEFKPLVGTILGLNDFHPKSMWKPGYTSGSGYTLAPGDLATIYDINGLYQQGFDGSGQKIAVVGQAAVQMADIQQFRTSYGLGPAKITMVQNGTPWVDQADMIEADLDLEWAGAIAPNAMLIYVYGADADSAAFYAIDQNLAPVVSESFGLCEAVLPPSVPPQVEAEAKKGNAMGITWLASSGDQGAAACDYGEATASLGLAVNFPASVPEVTAVGGTEFNEGNGTYLGSTNGTHGNSALSYIPEMAWNDTIPVFVLETGPSLASTGGGISTLFPKPSWQIGPGVPADGQRDVPDIALASSNLHDPYNIVSSGQPLQVGGTSAATPVFAGMVALLNQYLKQSGAGNLNASLYELALSTPSMFHDVVNNNNVVPCVAGSPDCEGGTLGYNAGIAYDMTTGLGSVDLFNLVTGWSAATSSVAAPVISSVKNAASFAAGAVSPGEMVAIAGTGLGPTQPGGPALNGSGFVSAQYSTNAVISVDFNGIAAPLISTSSTSISAMVPYEIEGPTAKVTVTYQGKTSAPVTVNVAAAAPGIFTADSSGAGVASAVNSNGRTPNSLAAPAAQGSSVSFYATGAGQTSPAGVDGALSASPLPTPILPVTVTIGGVPAVVQFAGAAFGEVAGIMQISAVVPATVSGTVPVVIQVGNAVSQPGVTLVVAAGPAFTITSEEIVGSVVASGTGALACAAPSAKSSFLTTDPVVWVYFTYVGAQVGDLLAVNWVHPSGQLDASQPSLVLQASGTGCAAAPLTIAGTEVSQDPGNWQVKIFRNGTFQLSLPFTINP